MSITQDIRDTFSRRDNALNQLIVINVLVYAVLVLLRVIFFVAQSAGFEVIEQQLVLSSSGPVLLRHPWTLLTYSFAHVDFFHILFNMLNLYWFGRLIQEYLGNQRVVSLYVLGALAGAAFFLLAYNFLGAFQGYLGQPILGASAAVTAIIVAAATLLPDYTFVMFLIGAVKIKWIAAFVVVALSLEVIYTGNPGGGIAHLGGALLGYIFIKQLNAGRDLGQPVMATGQWLGRLFNRQPMKVTHRGTAAASAKSTQKANSRGMAPEDEVNSILDKISRSGYESLSKEEKQKLFQASQQ